MVTLNMALVYDLAFIFCYFYQSLQEDCSGYNLGGNVSFTGISIVYDR